MNLQTSVLGKPVWGLGRKAEALPLSLLPWLTVALAPFKRRCAGEPCASVGPLRLSAAWHGHASTHDGIVVVLGGGGAAA